jgi:hypothetical protein
MTHARYLTLVALLIAGVIAGCGSSSEPAVPQSSHVVHVPGTSETRIVLSAVGVERIGIRTARVQGSRGKTGSSAIPYSAVIYDPNGQTYAFTALSRLTYTENAITIDHISGNTAYLRKGPRVGAQVVTVGAEELYGVQSGVLAQT